MCAQKRAPLRSPKFSGLLEIDPGNSIELTRFLEPEIDARACQPAVIPAAHACRNARFKREVARTVWSFSKAEVLGKPWSLQSAIAREAYNKAFEEFRISRATLITRVHRAGEMIDRQMSDGAATLEGPVVESVALPTQGNFSRA